MRGVLDQTVYCIEGQSSLRLLMTLIVLCGVSVSSVASISMMRIEESESPFKAQEEVEKDAEEAFVSRKRCVHLRPGAGKPGRLCCDARPRILFRPAYVPTGHRLANGVAAPLRC
jgi:hypothetical protein